MSPQEIEEQQVAEALKCLNTEELLSLQKLIRYPHPIHQDEASGLCLNNENDSSKTILSKSSSLYELELTERDKITKGLPIQRSYNILLTAKNTPINSIKITEVSQKALTRVLLRLTKNCGEIKPKVQSKGSCDFLTVL